MGVRYPNIIVTLDGGAICRWGDQVIRSMVRADVDPAQISVLRNEIKIATLYDDNTDQTIKDQLIGLFNQWVTVKEKKK